MRLFRDLLIRRKLILIMTLSSCVTLLVACIAWLGFDWSTYRRALTQEVSVVAEVVGRSAASAIDFDDPEAMQASLEALTEHQHVRRAVLFSPDGGVLASYRSSAAGVSSTKLAYQREGTTLENGGLVVFRPIVSEGAEIGSIAIEADFDGLHERQLEFVQVVFLVLLLCVLLAFGMAYKLQGVISGPLVLLTNTMRAVSERKDYALRARKMGRDEVGFLTEAFNEMLAAIQDRDAELEKHRNTLEEEVNHRTLELTEKNEQLRKSMEEAKAAAVAKAQFLANVSHEIRTPMNGILGMNELLLDSPLDAQQRSYAEIVTRSAESLLELINDILDFSKIEAGKLRLETIDFDPFKVVEEVVGLLAGPARKKGLDLVCWITPEIPPVVRGDPTRLRQVLTNLLGNAVKFTDQGRVSVRAELLESIEDSVRIKIVVQDSGIGISREDRERLFHSFAQLDSSTTRRFGGTGLGLAICKQLAELMGGEISVESEPGVGSTFWFTATLQRASNERRNLLMPEGFAVPRILIADTSSAVREVIHQQLLAWRCAHEVAADEAGILALLRAGMEAGEPVELFFLDQEFVGQEGELVRELQRSAGQGTKIVLMSWAGAQERQVLPFGVRGQLFKPIRPSQLFDALLSFAAHAPEVGSDRGSGDARVPGASGARCLHVLVAEDNAINQLVASRVLAKGGHTHQIVADGAKALEAVQRGGFELVLMDCQMPVVDGFEATRLIREWERSTGRPPIHIIALTANAMASDRERCLQVGMNDYLSKPVKPDVLLERLATWAEENRAADEDAGESFARVRRSLQAEDAREARGSARELCESLTRFASGRMHELARELERWVEEGRLDRAETCLEELEREFAAREQRVGSEGREPRASG